MRGDRQSRRTVRDRSCPHDLRVDLGQRRLVDADFHEARPDRRAVDAVLGLADPARGELIRGLGERVTRQVLVVRRTVVAGVGEDVQAGCVGQALEQPDVAPDVGRCALEHGCTAKLADLHEMREGDLERLVGIVAARVDLAGADEVHEHVLVHERDAEPVGGDRSGHALDHARRGVPTAAGR